MKTWIRLLTITEQFVQLFVVTDGELQVTRNDTLLLVVTSSVTGQFENFSREVFEDGSEVDYKSASVNAKVER
jgi:hypothetical protein